MVHFDQKIQALALSGEDCKAFLENLTTQSVLKQCASGLMGFHNILDSKGKILFDFRVYPWAENQLLITADLELESLQTHFNKMIFAEDVEIQLRSVYLKMFEGDEFWDNLEYFQPWKCQSLQDHLFCFSLFSHSPGLTVISPRPIEGDTLTRFAASVSLNLPNEIKEIKETNQTKAAQENDHHFSRLKAGIPHSKHLIGQLFNHVGLLDLYLDENKGCYPGQEIVTRISQRGQSNKHLGYNSQGEVNCYKLNDDSISFPPHLPSPLLQSSAESLYHLGLKSFHQGQYNEAIQTLEKSLRLNPHAPDSWEALGVCFERSKQLELAIQTHKKFARLSPRSVMAHANLSRLYMLKGWIEQAEKEQEIARQLNFEASALASGADAEALANAQQQLDKEKEKRVQMFLQVLEMDPEDDIALFGLGKFYQDKKEPAMALEYLEKLINIKPDYAAAYPILVKALIAMDNLKAAMHWLPIGQKVCEDQGAMVPFKQLELQKKKLPPH